MGSKNVNLQTVNDPKKSKNSRKIFARGEQTIESFDDALAEACRGLAYISETDANLEPFIADEPNSRTLRSYLDTLGIDEKIIEEVSLDKFFARLTTEKDWHRAVETRRVRQFSKLKTLLEENLEDLHVIRVGRIRIDIYIVGVAADGRLAGVKTKAIET